MFVLNTLPPYCQGIVSRLIQTLKMDDSGKIAKKKAEFFPPFKEFFNDINVTKQLEFRPPSERISDNETSKLLHPLVSCKANDMIFSSLSSKDGNYSHEKNEKSVNFSIAKSNFDRELLATL